jgi:hypothetical protein
MTETGSTGRVQPAEDTAWAVDPEVPDVDADEQRRSVVEDDPEAADPEAIAGRDLSQRLIDPPLEISEADLVDQVVEIPYDDLDDRG